MSYVTSLAQPPWLFLLTKPQDLLGCTPEDHPDFEDVRLAHDNISDLALFINEKKRAVCSVSAKPSNVERLSYLNVFDFLTLTWIPAFVLCVVHGGAHQNRNYCI